ncbi:hypothetical protein FOZ61_001964 [Perkinsus olseni]|uniref:Uncharacterized protein n=1 Tax=Perkinsus olseni TaxID=32597 RepID=A0A7J6LV03_PEROL|nr:hypothetical protein FOL46_005173 [Perkinsus olseni]KAF4663095.1 hypothetical protein FOZ61_001964 [Perkinsus olseni]
MVFEPFATFAHPVVSAGVAVLVLYGAKKGLDSRATTTTTSSPSELKEARGERHAKVMYLATGLSFGTAAFGTAMMAALQDGEDDIEVLQSPHARLAGLFLSAMSVNFALSQGLFGKFDKSKRGLHAYIGYAIAFGAVAQWMSGIRLLLA